MAAIRSAKGLLGMYDNYIMIVSGLVLIVASIFAKGVSYGMAPHRRKPIYPATRRLRVLLLSVGLLFIALGLSRVMHK
jgi:hypothetical protein